MARRWRDEPGAALGRAIKIRRIALGMERRDLAGAAELSYPYLSEIENGVKSGSPRALRRVASALGLELHELLGQAAELERLRPVPEGAGAGVVALPSVHRVETPDEVDARARRRSQLLHPQQPVPVHDLLDDPRFWDPGNRLAIERFLRSVEPRLRAIVRDELRRAGLRPVVDPDDTA
jgi:transcriptional regulator with XRE-family HTH domain